MHTQNTSTSIRRMKLTWASQLAQNYGRAIPWYCKITRVQCSGDHRCYSTVSSLKPLQLSYTRLPSLQLHLSPCSSNQSLSERPPFPYSPPAAPVSSSSRSTNYRLSSKLDMEAKVILALLTKLIIGETDTSELRPGWMRVLVMEIMCR